MIKNPLTYEIMTPQSVGVPGMRLVLGKHSGRHALALRCEALNFRLDHRELDQLYRQLLMLADNSKVIEDRQVLELIKKAHKEHSALDTRAVSLPASTSKGTVSPLYPSKAAGSRNGVEASWAASELEVEQQEDYLWGV
jgi:isopropylmalate/homocitrate/citramalate synthase